MKKIFHAGIFVPVALLIFAFACLHQTISGKTPAPGDTEFRGSFDNTLIANTDDMDDVIFKPVTRSQLNFAVAPAAGARITATRLIHPVLDRTVIISALVENEGAKPVLFVDLDMDGTLAETEKFTMEKEETDNPYIWQTTVQLPTKGKRFPSYPLYLMFFKDVQYGDEMTENDRLILKSSKTFARGKVDIKGKPTVVIYEYDEKAQKVTPTSGWLGVDSDGDGEVDIDELSPEATKADDETVVFRAGQTYVSTKKVDLEKNLIVMREHPASDYKRVELRVGDSLPDFNFTDFYGKKRRFSEFHGKYVLLDFWGMWCPPCRRELPYLKAAYTKFQTRNFEIVGMNTDTDFTPEQINEALRKNSMNWTQAQVTTIIEVIRSYRVSSFPTTILLDPEGKILSLNQTKKGQPSLRGKELLETLDKILPSK